MNTKSNSFLLSSECKWENTSPGISRQILGYDEHIMIVKVQFEIGSIGYLHSHFHSQSTYIESGKFEVNINGEKQILQAGDGFHIQPDLPHAVVCLEAGVLIDAFSPARQDFLK